MVIPKPVHSSAQAWHGQKWLVVRLGYTVLVLVHDPAQVLSLQGLGHSLGVYFRTHLPWTQSSVVY